MADKKKFSREDVILSPCTEDDIQQIAEATFVTMCMLMDATEPEELRPPLDVRIARFAKRMKPTVRMPHSKWTKACLKRDPDRIIGHSGWTDPEFGKVFNPWRKDAMTGLGWAEKEGWSQAEMDEMWAGTDEGKWQNIFFKFDEWRSQHFGDEGHWLLAPLWVLPEYQGRGIARMLLEEVFEITDAQDPPSPIVVEATAAGLPIYQHLGFELIQEKPRYMVRRGPRASAARPN